MTTVKEHNPAMVKSTQSFPLHILVMCTGNSARSIMAEALFNTIGSPLFRASSAGSKPTGQVNPLAMEQVQTLGGSTASYRSKSWREFTGSEGPAFDIILTVCDNAAADDCPLLDGWAEHIHWGLTDPAATQDPTAAQRAFAACFAAIKARIETLVSQANNNTLPGDTIAAMRQFE